MNAPIIPSILAQPSSGQLNIQQLNDLKTLLRRGLNTWEDAPAWLLSLSDQVDAETTTCSMGLPASCGGALCAPAEHHPLCGLNQSPSQASEAHDVCPNCDGSGTVLERSDNSPDAHEVSVTCPHCNGSGALADAYRGAVDLLKVATAKYHQALPYMVKAKEPSGQPVLYVSPNQLQGLLNGSAQGFKDLDENFGGYLPVRSSPSGLFTHPLYSGTQQDGGDASEIARLKTVIDELERREISSVAADVTQKQQAGGEVVAWQFFDGHKWWNGDDRIKDHRKNTEEAGYPVRDLVVATHAPKADSMSLPQGWCVELKDDDEGRSWLTVHAPNGAYASVSARTKDGNGNRTIVAQVWAQFCKALSTHVEPAPVPQADSQQWTETAAAVNYYAYNGKWPDVRPSRPSQQLRAKRCSVSTVRIIGRALETPPKEGEKT